MRGFAQFCWQLNSQEAKREHFSHFVEATVEIVYYCYKNIKVSMFWQVLPAERRSHKMTLDIAGLG